MFKLKVDDKLKHCEIWVAHDNKSNYKSSVQYKEVVEKYQALKYKITVFIGGTKPLLATVSELLEHQIEENLVTEGA